MKLSDLKKKQPNIKLLTPYKGYRDYVDAQCKICHYIWQTMGGNIARGYGCPKCGLKKARETVKWHISQEQFLSKIPNDFLSKIEIMGSYTSQHCEIPVRCKKCNETWTSTPYRLYRKQGCTPCGRARKGLKSRKTHDQFLKTIYNYHADAITILGEYQTSADRIEVRCNQCGRIWMPSARNIQRRGCVDCASSLGEKAIVKFLDQHSITYKREYIFSDLLSPIGGRLRFDFAIFSSDTLSYLIEYDGKQHDIPVKYMGGEERFKRQQANDQLKNQYCIDHNIDLIRIHHTQKNQIETILQDRIASR